MEEAVVEEKEVPLEVVEEEEEEEEDGCRERRPPCGGVGEAWEERETWLGDRRKTWLILD
jgi:hypothetical protein